MSWSRARTSDCSIPGPCVHPLQMAPRLLIFTGAPPAAALRWDEGDLLNTFCEPIARFAGLYQEWDPSLSFVPATAEPAVASDNASANWISFRLERQHLTTGFSQLQGCGNGYEETAFFDSVVEDVARLSFSNAASMELAEQVLSQFYESYANHDGIHSSKILSTQETGSLIYSNESTSFGSYESPLASFPRPPTDVPVAGPLMNLKDIPNAKYLASIYPQTMTANLITGIISISPPRPIKTRRGGDVELVEVLVGDETRSGFVINFWMYPSQSAAGGIRSVLGGLRPQDVILMRNVALNSFRGKVYGQNLRREMTRVQLLYRSRIDKTDVGGCYNSTDLALGGNIQIEKAGIVREWVLRFVGTGLAIQMKSKGKTQADVFKEILPLDTQ